VNFNFYISLARGFSNLPEHEMSPPSMVPLYVFDYKSILLYICTTCLYSLMFSRLRSVREARERVMIKGTYGGSVC
jgi:hypothetical protein